MWCAIFGATVRPVVIVLVQVAADVFSRFLSFLTPYFISGTGCSANQGFRKPLMNGGIQARVQRRWRHLQVERIRPAQLPVQMPRSPSVGSLGTRSPFDLRCNGHHLRDWTWLWSVPRAFPFFEFKNQFSCGAS